MRVSDRVRECVLFIGTTAGGQFVPYGTGFVTASNTGGRHFQQIITARHVIDQIPGNTVYIRGNLKAGGTEVFASDKSDWLFHPAPGKNRMVDVAVLPSHVPPEIFSLVHIVIDQEVATEDVIADQSIGVGDDVFVTGLFTSHIGEVRNIPIVRCGTIAAMPEEPIWTAEGYADAYLIEARSIGGLSGSPVFVHIAPFRTIEGEVQTARGYTHYLLGLMQGHFMTQSRQDAVLSEEDDGAMETISTGIGVVVPAQKILETINQPALADQREAAVESLKRKSGFVKDSARGAAPLATADNPQHREDFTRLLGAAARKTEPDDRT